MFGIIPTWKVLLGAALQIIPIGGAFFAYDRTRISDWKKPALAAGVYGALQLGVAYINLQLLTPSIPEIAQTVENLFGQGQVTGVGSLYLPHDGGLPRPLPMRRGIGLVDASLRMARAS